MGGKARTTVTGIAATPTGGGYWLVDIRGGVTPFGDASLHPGTLTDCCIYVTGISADSDGTGYYLIHEDGQVDAFGGLGAPPPATRGRADLAVTLHAPLRAHAGNTLTYQVTVVNRGPGAVDDAVASLTLPAGVTAVRVLQHGSRTASGSLVRWQLPVLGPGVRTTLVVTGTASSSVGTRLCASAAAASAHTRDPDLRNNAQLGCTTIR